MYSNRAFGLPARVPCIAPNQLRLERFEESFIDGIIIIVTPSAHRHLKTMFFEQLLVITQTILRTTIRVVDAAFGWLAKGRSHLQCSYRQTMLHTTAAYSPVGQWMAAFF